MKSMKELIGKITYSQKLKSDQWIEFARRMKENANYSCQVCRRGKVILQVHHWFYEYGREPWEYDQEEVIVLCEGCHKEYHALLNDFRRYVFSKMTPQAFRVLNGALAVAFTQYDPLVFAHAIAELASNPGMVERYQKSWADSTHSEVAS